VEIVLARTLATGVNSQIRVMIVVAFMAADGVIHAVKTTKKTRKRTARVLLKPRAPIARCRLGFVTGVNKTTHVMLLEVDGDVPLV